MPVFVIDIEAKPTSMTPRAADIESASAIIFVVAEDKDEALTKARDHIINYGWLETKISALYSPTPEQIARLETDIAAVHAQALQFGLASTFYVYPKVPRDEATAPEYRSLGSPVIKKQ